MAPAQLGAVLSRKETGHNLISPETRPGLLLGTFRSQDGPYDKATLAALEQAFSDAWAVLEARDPLRDWVKDGQLSSNLSEKLMALADKGITKPDELCKRALKGLPRRRAA